MSKTMKVVQIQAAPAQSAPYSVTNPAPASAIHIIENAPIPQIKHRGEILVHIKASTVIRDSLTWPELYAGAELGNDFSGLVADVHKDENDFQPGDEVYGMTSANRGGTWAEYAVVKSEEVYQKPQNLSWEEAAALPLSGMTAEQALFEKARLSTDATEGQKKKVLITGASGAVGMYLVQLAAHAGHNVVAASSSNARNEAFLRSLGAHEIIEYGTRYNGSEFDVVVDTVGGEILARSWKAIKDEGTIISIDSSSFDFVNEHREAGITASKNKVRALWFVLEPSKRSMKVLSDMVEKNGLRGLVAKILPLDKAAEAYVLAHVRDIGRGKIVLVA